MCWHDVLEALRGRFPGVTGAKVRWAIDSGKVSRPPRDGSLRFVFGPRHVDELLAYFGTRGGCLRAETRP